jgi:hypothetical protein
MCLLIGNGGSKPLSRSTRQSPSSEPATTTLERTNQQIDDEREKERQQQGDDETTWRAPVDPNAASTVTPSMQALDERARVLEAEHGLYLGVVALTVPCTNASRDSRPPYE